MRKDYVFYDMINVPGSKYDAWYAFVEKGSNRLFATDGEGNWIRASMINERLENVRSVNEKSVGTKIIKSRGGHDLEASEKLAFSNKNPMEYYSKQKRQIGF